MPDAIGTVENGAPAPATIEKLRERHPRAMQLLEQDAPFIVIAVDDPYFMVIFDLIRAFKISTGEWMQEDERLFLGALKAAQPKPG